MYRDSSFPSLGFLQKRWLPELEVFPKKHTSDLEEEDIRKCLSSDCRKIKSSVVLLLKSDMVVGLLAGTLGPSEEAQWRMKDGAAV